MILCVDWRFAVAKPPYELMVNHAWRGLKVKMGWGDGGRLATLGAGALTFLAVVVGWVFFRADSFSSAMTMLHGMVGMNGVSLPMSLEGKLGQYVALYDWVVFSGTHPLVASLNITNAAIFFVLGFSIIWLIPNVRQLFQHYRPTCEDLNEGVPSAILESPPILQGKLFQYFLWQPTKKRAWATAALFALTVMELTQVSEFLYFQFLSVS